MNKYCLVFFVFIFFPFINVDAQGTKPLAGKEPSWITPKKVNYDVAYLDNDAEEGSVDILYDQQVFPEQQSRYCHKIIRILTEAGIQSTSEISINFDPSYQQLTFHTINIRRGTEVINQLHLSKIKTIHQEEDLHRYLYNGALTSILFLEDVRKGDVIEYSYTLKGFNPIFNGKYSDSYDFGYSVPIYNLYYKLITSRERSTTIRNKNTEVKPDTSNSENHIIYEWKLDNIKPLHTQDGIPSWYDPYPIVQVSEYADWKEVNDWAMKLFPVVKQVMPALQKKIDDIKTQHTDTSQQILAALRFVQDDVRYMGIEMGINSHQPGRPDKIFAQRFGDCKDKSYLLCTLLRHLGIEASPVLINTSSKEMITGYLPSAGLFDHVIVRVSLGQSYYWFDPTISFQRGAIGDISFPDYQCGLVISENTTGLTLIENKEPGTIKVNETFNIEDMSGKATLVVVTTYTGSFADDIRNDFSSSSTYEMLKGFKDYYARYFEHIVADSLSYTDNESSGAFTTREFYRVNDLWEIKGTTKKAFFESFVINGIIRKPKELNRTMPFALNYPVHLLENVEINVPDDWEADESSHKIESAAFTMTSHFSYRNRKFLLLYEYENLKNAVAPDEMAGFLEAVAKKDNETGYSLSKSGGNDLLVNKSPKKTQTRNSEGNAIAILVFSLFIGVIIWRLRRA